jgi:hypothetical protein
VAELERNLIKERVNMGISRARKEGKHIGRPTRQTLMLDRSPDCVPAADHGIRLHGNLESVRERPNAHSTACPKPYLQSNATDSRFNRTYGKPNAVQSAPKPSVFGKPAT